MSLYFIISIIVFTIMLIKHCSKSNLVSGMDLIFFALIGLFWLPLAIIYIVIHLANTEITIRK